MKTIFTPSSRSFSTYLTTTSISFSFFPVGSWKLSKIITTRGSPEPGDRRGEARGRRAEPERRALSLAKGEAVARNNKSRRPGADAGERAAQAQSRGSQAEGEIGARESRGGACGARDRRDARTDA